MKFDIKNTIVTQHYDRRLKRIMEIYINERDRPINNGDILGDFAWRRTHKPSVQAKVLKEILEPMFGDNIKVKYNRYAGCSMCPCSPGFVVISNERHYKKVELFVDVIG